MAEEGISTTNSDLSDITSMRDGICKECWKGPIKVELDRAA